MDLYDELVNGPLAAELSPLIADGNDGAILAALTRKDIPAKGKVESHDIRQYLMLVDLLIPIEQSSALSCIAAKRSLEIFPIFDLSQPMILAKFEQILDALVAETLIPDFTAEHKAVLLSLADKLISREEQMGVHITETDIKAAIWFDNGDRRI